jgi:hypothetical protein
MNERQIEELWQKHQADWGITESQFRQATGLTRESYMLPRKAEYLGESHITMRGNPVWDVVNNRRVRFFGATADGSLIMIVGNDGSTFEGLRRPFQLRAY